MNDFGHRVVILGSQWDSVSGQSFLRRRWKQIYNLFVRKCFVEELSPTENGKRLIIHKLRIPKVRYLNKISLLIILSRYMKENKYEAAHLHFIWYAYLLFFIQKYFRLPSVITLHGSDLDKPLGSSKEDKERNHAMYYKVMQRAKKIIFVANHLKNKAVRDYAYNVKESVVIPNGIELNVFYPSSDKNKKKMRVGYVGRIEKAKGVLSLPFIFAYIKNVYPRTSFLILGKNELSYEEEVYMKKSIELQEVKNCTKFFGELSPDQIGSFMRELDVLVLPSDTEGYPCVVVEARACGVPVVATDVGGAPEALAKGGLLVKKGADFEKRFADAVVQMLRNPPPLAELTRDILTWEEVVQRELEIYEGILKKRAS